MKKISFGGSGLLGSRLAYGCWRIAGSWDSREITGDSQARGRQALLAAVEAGYTVFDHADIYCDGEAEKLFGRLLEDMPGLRERLVICTKCGIRKPGDPKPSSPHRYDFSAEYVLRACEQSLRRLKIETIDLYLLHRPDYLMDPSEVAAAFAKLKHDGKVREFGVSNFHPAQFTALQRACAQPLVAHQVELSLLHLNGFEDGTLDQCLTESVTPMAWSPLGGGALGAGAKKVLPSQQAYQPEAVHRVLDELAAQHSTSRTAVALAWLLKHPARMMPIVGSTDPANIQAAAQADTVDLSREEWYHLLRAARGQPLP